MRALLPILLLLAGCSSQRFCDRYVIEKPVVIYVCDWRTLKAEWAKVIAVNPDLHNVALGPQGWADVAQRVIWLGADRQGEPPKNVLGHEVWHLPELGGPFYHAAQGCKYNIVRMPQD